MEYLGPGGLRVPPMVVVNLDFVNFFNEWLVFFRIVSHPNTKPLAQAACVRHACLCAPCVGWPLLLPLFSLSFSLLAQAALRAPPEVALQCVFSPSSAFDPLRGIFLRHPLKNILTMWDSLVRALDTKKLNDFLQKDT